MTLVILKVNKTWGLVILFAASTKLKYSNANTGHTNGNVVIFKPSC